MGKRENGQGEQSGQAIKGSMKERAKKRTLGRKEVFWRIGETP
jgi:hypothetical protein